ncbi:ABC transporter ATP-binding protein [Wukongibacter sp. M2B1]|uniref:ABC transporter ATP-binding protein n=1 Tax=Wukongibacter sp. M2B1 TaxID=3088895 RepID=UPI003D793EB9
MKEILEINNLSKSFEIESGKLLVLDGINMTVKNGEILCIVGPSGCGKSTLLSQIAGFDGPDTGYIKLGKNKISKPGLNRVMVFQDLNQLFPWKTVLENVVFPLKVNKIGNSKHERLEIAQRYLSMVKLEDFYNYYSHKLSGGMKQRVAIARALAINPEILLMDEPFGSLDIQTRTNLQNMLIDIWRKTKVTVIFVTHDIQEAILLSNRIIVMGKSPGNIKKVINNELPRPRNIIDGEFSMLYKEVYNLMEV